MTSPGHRAAVGFLHGGLLAMLSLVITGPLAAVGLRFPWLAAAAPAIRLLVPVLGFAWAGAIGGAALGRNRRGSAAFAAGGASAGFLLVIPSGNLAGLTGFENPVVVASYGLGTSVAAFGAMGLVSGLALGCGSVAAIAAGFAAGGAAGGLIGIAPFLLARFGPIVMPPVVGTFVGLAGSFGSVLVPVAVGGLVAGRVVGRPGHAGWLPGGSLNEQRGRGKP